MQRLGTGESKMRYGLRAQRRVEATEACKEQPSIASLFNLKEENLMTLKASVRPSNRALCGNRNQKGS